MSLTTALGTARSSLFNTSRQTSVVSQNIANAQNPDYNKRTAVLVSTAPGRSRGGDPARGERPALSTEQRGDFRLGGAVGPSERPFHAGPFRQRGRQRHLARHASGRVPVGAAALLGIALQSRARRQRGGSRPLAVERAQCRRRCRPELRSQTDQQIGVAVDDLNRLLSRLDTVNDTVVAGTSSARTSPTPSTSGTPIVKQISQYSRVHPHAGRQRPRRDDDRWNDAFRDVAANRLLRRLDHDGARRGRQPRCDRRRADGRRVYGRYPVAFRLSSASRRRRHDDAEPARRDRTKPRQLPSPKRTPRAFSRRRPVSSPGAAGRTSRPRARSFPAWREASRSMRTSIRWPAAIRRCCETAAPTARCLSLATPTRRRGYSDFLIECRTDGDRDERRSGGSRGRQSQPVLSDDRLD